MKTLKIRIYGTVHGVGFRYSTQQQADKLKLKGWVKNEVDGSVSAQVTGEDSAVDSFEKWCNHGPESAKVEKVTSEKKPTEKYQIFEVIH